MVSPATLSDIRMLVLSEGFGTQLFAVAERLTVYRRDKQMWDALHALECQTRAAVFNVLGDQVQHFASRDRLARSVGGVTATGLAVLPRRAQMLALVKGTQPFLQCFQRLAGRFAGTEHAAFFDYVLAHERAIADVGRRQLAGEAQPLAAVEALLGNVP